MLEHPGRILGQMSPTCVQGTGTRHTRAARRMCLRASHRTASRPLLPTTPSEALPQTEDERALQNVQNGNREVKSEQAALGEARV